MTKKCSFGTRDSFHFVVINLFVHRNENRMNFGFSQFSRFVSPPQVYSFLTRVKQAENPA